MILTLDIGNTNITCAIFDDDNLVKRFSMPSDTNLTVLDYGKLLKTEIGDLSFEGSIIGSVVDELNNRVQYAVLAQFGVMAVILSHKSKMPITLKIQNTEEIGADRIANGARGYNLFKDAVIVVDFGTATTFDIVNSKGEFLGGIIAPGIKTQLKSLMSATSKLKEVEIRKPGKNIGNNTEDCILSGVIRGTAGMVDEMIKNCESELGEKAHIILTGGFCEIVAEYMKTNPDLINTDLTLEGLRELYLLNKPKQPVYK